MCNPVTVYNPDHILLADTYRGYEYEVTCNGLAVRCGYVRIPAGHPWHGVGAFDLDARAHGGVNFAEADVNCGKGGPDDAWWLGFDCGHAFDGRDPSLPGWLDLYQRLNDLLDAQGGRSAIRSTGYVARWCRSLIRQADYAASIQPWNRRLALV